MDIQLQVCASYYPEDFNTKMELLITIEGNERVYNSTLEDFPKDVLIMIARKLLTEKK